MGQETHLCRISCDSMPAIYDAAFGLAQRPMIHCDRTAGFDVMIYLVNGGMEIYEDGTRYELTPGTLFFLKRGVHHWGVRPFLIGTSWYYAHFAGREPDEMMYEAMDTGKKKTGNYETRPSVKEIELKNGFLTIPKILRLPPENSIKESVEEMVMLFQSEAAGDGMRARMMLWEIFLRCTQMEQLEKRKSLVVCRIDQVTEFLKINYIRNFSPKELEEQLGLTYKYIGMLFKEKTGMTIKEYQRMIRLQRAVKLLCETEMSVSQIAAETGFYDAFYFSRIFKQDKGVSPLKFRETYQPRI